MIVTQAVREKGDAWFAAGTVARMLHAELGGMCRVLGVAQDRSKERQSEQRRKALERYGHHGLLVD
jgi:acetylglutamate kinase